MTKRSMSICRPCLLVFIREVVRVEFFRVREEIWVIMGANKVQENCFSSFENNIGACNLKYFFNDN